ncbi:hypothetical protein SHJG_p1166 (plasmid) [Streptomyces hygroscopicus subsp. jinggangensis 5008]|nr:hypothetical protein SHJG_p1166 [Streptomyces hygroscopicus subsp. jinggangensis 5008]AGF68451.1 hypothetical protein SHJGH_p1166 [Streptomyces hygroscopicus subsp. jinggangensis TL01]
MTSSWNRRLAEAETTWSQRLAEAGPVVRESRRPFDVAEGLRRLAADAGYVRRAPASSSGARARRQLDLISWWIVTEAGAASHVEELAALIGHDGTGKPTPDDFTGWLPIDIHGIQVFACVLHLANHPESAVFWWQLAAGAEHTGAAYCLHLRHLSQGEIREAALWKRQMAVMRDRTSQQWFDGPANDYTRDLVGAVEAFAACYTRHRAPRPIPTRHLHQRYESLADRHDEDGLVCRPDSRLPDRIQELTAPH